MANKRIVFFTELETFLEASWKMSRVIFGQAITLQLDYFIKTDRWHITVSDSLGATIVSNRKIICGITTPIYEGDNWSLMAVPQTSDESPPGWEGFQSRVKLILMETTDE